LYNLRVAQLEIFEYIFMGKIPETLFKSLHVRVGQQMGCRKRSRKWSRNRNRSRTWSWNEKWIGDGLGMGWTPVSSASLVTFTLTLLTRRQIVNNVATEETKGPTKTKKNDPKMPATLECLLMGCM